jgi:FXSXX-COOH protein
MDSCPDHQSGEHDTESGLVNVSAMTLVELLAANDSAIANSIRRLADETGSTVREPVAGFGNVAPGLETTH